MGGIMGICSHIDYYRDFRNSMNFLSELRLSNRSVECLRVEGDDGMEEEHFGPCPPPPPPPSSR